MEKPAPRASALRGVIDRNLIPILVVLLVVGCAGWCWLLYSQLRWSAVVAPASAATYAGKVVADADGNRFESGGISTYVRTGDSPTSAAPGTRPVGAVDGAAALGAARQRSDVAADGESAAGIVARDWSFFEPERSPERSRKAARARPLVHLASLDSMVPRITALHPATAAAPASVPFNIAAKTRLVHFDTAPFPYHGTMPGSNRPFLNAGNAGHRGHVNFRGRILWEAETFSDDRVLLHIPPGFDPQRPAVMVVFFHGHGADLARDVRDRQQVPEQITAAGINAVLVAPQFAFDAADSSAGKFWEPNGFKHFLDEAARKLASLYGDPRSGRAFADMPIVIVAYSGGFGPTLSVLARGGVRSRVRGLVLLDALYGGMEQFADWIANNRSTFFVSSYTPHTAGRNAELERLLSARSVAYGSQLRPGHLQGMVAFLPAGPVSHRDFVTHAWADRPIKDILARMEDVDPKVQVARTTASIPAAALAATRN